MSKIQKLPAGLQPWLARSSVQWLIATVVFFLLSWLFMGSALTQCANTSTALGSDSTGGFAWIQWAGGNDLTWGHTDKSYYPFGETLGKPQFVTSTILIGLYKVFSTLTTPICGLNLLVLLGYMSTALLMFGLVKWLLRRPDIALFAGFAAAFVPFHTLKSQSHINYMYSSIFIATIWAYLWFLQRPSYKRSAVLAVVGVSGFYFDGYFVLFSAVLVAALFCSSFIIDGARVIVAKKGRQALIGQSLRRLKYLAVSSGALLVLLVPIAVVNIHNGAAIRESLVTVRSDIKVETLIYGVRPIEFLLPSASNRFVPAGYPAWRATKLHGSNFSESTLYVGYTVLLLSLVALAGLYWRRFRQLRFQNMSYFNLIFIASFAFLACLALSLPATAYLFGHHIPTPVDLLVRLTANWRVLSRFFLVMDPLLILLASFGLYLITMKRSRIVRLTIVAACSLLLFLEYLPAPLHPTGNLYANAPPIYKQLRSDTSAKIVAEYPLADFTYTPEIFTFQPIHNKTLLNPNDGSLSRGPFDASLAGLNDPQTLGALKQLKVDVIITHGFSSSNPGLAADYPDKPILNPDGTLNIPASAYSYKIRSDVPARSTLLQLETGYEALSVDTQQISHRIITNQGTMRIYQLSGTPAALYDVSFMADSICPTNAQVSVVQSGQTLWSGAVSQVPVSINLTLSDHDFSVKVADCSVDVTNMSAQPASFREPGPIPVADTKSE